MEKIEPGAPESQSADLAADNLAQLRALFPELVTEGKTGPAINVDVLKALVGDATVTDADEKYGLNWHGKRAARQLALTPSTGTLRPCPEDSVDWDTTQNLMIEGDNLEVLKLLQKSYAGKVKLIYIDPPYNTGKDFVYPDDFKDNIKNYLELTCQVEGGRKISSNTEASGRFHTDWLNMMYPRLRLARQLLRDDGIIFVSIDDGEFENARRLLNEIYGEENFIANFIWKRKAGGGDDSGHVAAEHEYVICFAKDSAAAGIASVQHESPAMTAKYNRSEGGRRYYLERLDKTSLTYNSSMDFPIECPDGTFIRPPQPNPANPTTSWRWGKETVQTRAAELIFQKDKTDQWRVYTRTWEPKDGVTPRTLMVEKEYGRNRDGTQELDALLGPKIFNNPKPTKFLSHLLNIGAAEKDAVVLDFFAGSGSLADALIRMNSRDQGCRRFILVQLPEPTDRLDFTKISSITRERILRAGAKAKAENPLFSGDVGFRVFKLDKSNIAAWAPKRDDLAKSLLDHLEHVVTGRSDDDVLYEMLIKLGLNLCVPIEPKLIAGKTVQSIGGGVLLACLDEQITVADAEPLALGIVAWHREQQTAGEVTCVFRDSAFENDVAKTNLAAILEQHGIAKVRSL
ncbi:site-specific DNA-methyltransferase [Sphaerotilus sulfidivorans]|uniref:site-specific DNA-methyltransferase n=1 Tax=Sphaerotilus sulfidivorans TaxID=639200 RepID=UPI001CA8FFA7|nr:site-specific DNA-methyltransferase [Sphaerotilus sulfidivorans]